MHTRTFQEPTRPEVARDKELVERARLDHREFARIYDSYFERIYAFAASRTPDRATAEDVTSETFRRALAGFAGFEWRGVPLSGWLFRIARNVVSDLGRQRTVVLPPHEEDPDPAMEIRCTLYQLVDRLPEAQRRVIVMRFGRERSIRETASAIGRSEGAVKQLQLRAIRTLRGWLNEEA